MAITHRIYPSHSYALQVFKLIGAKDLSSRTAQLFDAARDEGRKRNSAASIRLRESGGFEKGNRVREFTSLCGGIENENATIWCSDARTSCCVGVE